MQEVKTPKSEEPTPALQLFAAFEDDHRILTQGLHQLLKFVQQRDLRQAARLAKELDHQAGAHIEFEEEVFYPSLRRKLPRAFVEQLYDEHHAGKTALQRLQDLPSEPSETLEGDEVMALAQELRESLEVAHEHALSCGTLLSHLESLSDPELEEMLRRLRSSRRRAPRWTDRPSRMSAKNSLQKSQSPS